MRKIYYRTVKNNRIKLLGKTWCSENLQNGELDGRRLCFLTYTDDNDLAMLWGTEAAVNALQGTEEEALRAKCESDKIIAPDGYFRWMFWKEDNDK